MKKEIDGNIIELSINELDKCISFRDTPSKLVESINSGKRKAFAYIGGCALSIREEGYGHFSYFAVASDFRGNGIGSCIIDFAVKHFKNMGLEKIRLHVHKNNSNAIRLYKRKGFVYEFDITPEKIAMIKTI